MVKIEKVDYHGWKNSCRVSNGKIELIALTDAGPRIIHFGFDGGKNMFFVDPATLGYTGGEEWKVYGGHRLWHAPENDPRTYYPDNDPVACEIEGDTLILQPEAETTTGIKKEIIVRMHPEEARVDVEHRLTNTNLWTVELAPWALSVMAPGGRAIIPLPPKGTHPEHLLPNGNITLWAYTDMADPRWRWGTNFVFLDQDESAANPQKAGFFVEKGRAAYQNGEDVFIKHFRTEKGAKYPDRNVNVELFTNAEMLELETLGPLTSIAPGKSVVHTETWQMQRTTNALTKEEIPDFVLQKIT